MRRFSWVPVPWLRRAHGHPPVLAPPAIAIPLLALALGCVTEPSTAPEATRRTSPALTAIAGFSWRTASPESQGMCGSIKRLGCTKTLQLIWSRIADPIYNTKRFIVIRNDRVIFDQGEPLYYYAFSASKGLLGAPTLVHAMNRCGVTLTDRASRWLSHGDGARWGTDFPWTNITLEHLATHTSGVCDYGNTSLVCRDQNPGWQRAYEKAKDGGLNYVYPTDAFTIARAKAEQNRDPAVAPGSTLEYSNVGHALLNYVVQRACGQKLLDIFNLYIKQSGMGSPYKPALIYTDGGQQFNQSTGVARWNGLDGAAVLRMAGRRGIWDNRNVEPVRYWNELTKITGNIPVAAAAGWGVIYSNNSKNMWTSSTGYRRLSLETFGHGGNYSNLFINDPLTGTIVVRQGENNALGASYLTLNGCAPGWTGMSPTCTAGTDWSNNWSVSSGAVNFSSIGPKKKVVEPLQQAFFFPPPFCRMTAVGGNPVDDVTDVYSNPPGAATIDLTAEITVNPREGAGSSVAEKIEFYKETGSTEPQHIGNGALVAGTNPARYQLSYNAESHGAVSEVMTYFANCVAQSTIDPTRKVPSYSRPVRVKR
jgi:CubicO group peptidase (beta-lactamase class C family)